MARTRTTYTGDPGEVWTNTTGKVQFQFIANWVNTCGLCCQYDHQIGASWPIPLHRSCRCKQILVAPGQSAQPFTDFQATIATLDPTQQSKVVGRSNLTLIEKGVVKWEDVVTRSRVRDFREVVAKNSLSVKEMVKAGVNPRLAADAYTTVHTPAHELAAQQRQSLLDQLTKTGLTKDQVRQALAERLAARVGITSGPSGAGPSPIVPGTPSPPSKPVATPAKPASAKKKPKPKPIPLPVPLIAGGSPELLERAYLGSLGVKPEAIDAVQTQPLPTAPAWKPTPAENFKAFTSTREMEAWGQHFEPWSEALSIAERVSLKNYARELYPWMNGELRGKLPVDPIPYGGDRAGLQKMNASAAAGLEKATLPDAIVGYRGIKDLAKLGFGSVDELVPGVSLVEKGFSSVTLDQGKGKMFAGVEASDPVLFKVHVPKGSKGGYLNAGEIAEFDYEREVLFPPNAEYRVVGREESTSFSGTTIPVVVIEKVK